VGVARALIAPTLAAAFLLGHVSAQQAPAPGGGPSAPLPPLVTVRPIALPKHPLPAEEKTAGITRFAFIAYGDTRGAAAADATTPHPAHVRVVDTMLGTIKARARTRFPVRFVLQTGDAVFTGVRGEYWNLSYTPEVDRITAGADVPYYLTAGNHDVAAGAPLAAARPLGLHNMLAAFSSIIPPEGSPRRLNGYPTYAFGFGNLFVIAFDSNIASDQVQLAWVADQLARLDRVRFPHVAIFVHHPPYSSGPHGARNLEPQTTAMRSLYMPLFRRYHVDLVFSGHEHLFEHWVERYTDGGREYRMDTFVTGGGGAPTYTYRGEPDLAAYIAAAPGQNVRLEHLVAPGPTIPENPNHFIVVDVDGSRVSAEVVATSGSPFTPYKGQSRIELSK
jgi:3',5'-cyclic AMP phosphodiesterase CpdA